MELNILLSSLALLTGSEAVKRHQLNSDHNRTSTAAATTATIGYIRIPQH